MIDEIQKIEVKSVGHAHTHRGRNIIVFWSVDQDPLCGENPLEYFDGLGTIYSFCQKHVSFCHPDNLPEEHKDYRIALSYFEHGSCQWGVAGTMDGMPDFRWDGVRIAGCWYPNDCVMADYPKDAPEQERQEWLKKQAQGACDLYTSWCNGEVYDYSVRAFRKILHNGKLINTPRAYEEVGEELYSDNCGGYYGHFEDSGLLDDLRASLEEALKNDE